MKDRILKALSGLPSLGETDGSLEDRPAVWLFTPDGAGSWSLWEYDSGQMLAFGLCDLGLGFPEIGYVSIEELLELRGPFGLPIEMDRSIDTLVKGYSRLSLEVPEYLVAKERKT